MILCARNDIGAWLLHQLSSNLIISILPLYACVYDAVCGAVSRLQLLPLCIRFHFEWLFDNKFEKI